MPISTSGSYTQGPSCFDRMKMGFGIGFCVGLASGALFGGFSALRKHSKNDRRSVSDEVLDSKSDFIYLEDSIGCSYGIRGRELIQSVGKMMIQGGGTFGTFMAIGTGIRC